MKLTTTPSCQTCKVRNDSLLCLCPTDEVAHLDETKSAQSYRKGQHIFVENQYPLGLFCINSGTVKLSKNLSSGREQIVRIAHPGNFLGYRSLITNSPYHLTATALEDTVICLIPKNEFMGLLRSNDKFYAALMQLVCNDAVEAEERMADLAYKPVRGRIAEAILLLVNAYKVNEISLTREDLASFVGTVKETVIRIIGELKDERVIEVDKRKIKVLDKEKLAYLSNLYD